MLMRQFGFHVDGHECIEVKEGDTFSFGKHTVTFVVFQFLGLKARL